jgi:hypothetical protein
MNSAVLGGSVRQGLGDAYLKLERDEVELCVGNCAPWEESEEGRARYERLKARFKGLELEEQKGQENECS